MSVLLSAHVKRFSVSCMEGGGDNNDSDDDTNCDGYDDDAGKYDNNCDGYDDDAGKYDNDTDDNDDDDNDDNDIDADGHMDASSPAQAGCPGGVCGCPQGDLCQVGPVRPHLPVERTLLLLLHQLHLPSLWQPYV